MRLEDETVAPMRLAAGISLSVLHINSLEAAEESDAEQRAFSFSKELQVQHSLLDCCDCATDSVPPREC